MLHHLSFGTSDLARSTAFYDAVLTALGYARVWADDTAVGYGYPGTGDKLAIKLRPGGVTGDVDDLQGDLLRGSVAQQLGHLPGVLAGGAAEPGREDEAR